MTAEYTTSQILDYLADVSKPERHPEVITDFTKEAGHVVVSRPDRCFGGEDVPVALPQPSVDKQRREIQSRSARDLLDPTEQRLRLGWGWVGGLARVDGNQRRVLAPLVSVAIEVRTKTGGEPGIEMTAELEPIGDVLASDLISDPFAADAVLAGITFPGPGLHPEMEAEEWALEHYDELRGWLVSSAEAMGLEATAVAPTRDLMDLRNGSRPTVSPVGAVYLQASESTPRTRSDLADQWADTSEVDRRGSAFGALYLPSEDGEDDEPHLAFVDVGPTAVPLDGDQRRAVLAARTEPVSVIVGPPGTGKSHTVGAVALDAIGRGEKVLLATRSQHAASVLIDFLAETDAPKPVVFGDNRSRPEMVDDLWQRLSASPKTNDIDRIHRRTRAAHERSRRRLIDVLEVEGWFGEDDDPVERILAEERSEHVAKAVELTRIIDDPATGWWRRRRARAVLRRIGPIHPEELRRHRMTERLETGRADFDDLVADHVEIERRLHQTFAGWLRAAPLRGLRARQRRAAIQELTRALRSGRGYRRQILAKIDAEALLDAVPLWVGTIADVEDLLPRSVGLFDLVIVDEASQVDQAGAPAALLRARRLVAVGDANQLRHTSFLSDREMELGLTEAGLIGAPVASKLDLRRNSLLDVAAGTGPVVELSTHYRSDPHLIDFSSHRFYDGRVRPATRHPGRDRVDCIDVIRIDGTRSDEGNHDEVAAVIAHIKALMAAGGSETIGIVSPLRAQADLLAEAVLAAFPAGPIAQHQIAVGTVHAFQGAQRDHMVISLAVDDDSPAGSFRFVQNRNLFNVMVTRARSRCTVITSLEDLGSGLIADYVAHAETAPVPPPTSGPRGEWTRRVQEFLLDQGLIVRAGYPIAHDQVDLVVGDGADAVALDCEVHPDGPDAHIERRMLLDSMGWRVVEVFESRWRLDLAEFAIRFRTGDLRIDG